MAGKGLIIGIDYTDRYCQVCYYNNRHARPESVSAGTDVLRYLIPSVLCYDLKEKNWHIGNSALQIAENPECVSFSNLMLNARAGTTAMVEQEEYTYIRLFSVFFRKLLEFIQIRTAVMTVENINITMKNADRETRDILLRVFDELKISSARISLLNEDESFGYYILNEPGSAWEDGVLLFDFSAEGFFVKKIEPQQGNGGYLAVVSEMDLSRDFSVSTLSGSGPMEQMDKKLSNLYRDLTSGGTVSGVYFTGEGFDEQWFTGTLEIISASTRAFKGNNIYVKGACLAGYLRSIGETAKYPIICKGITRADISVEAWDRGELVNLILSPAARAWYEADFKGDFILENERSILFRLVSLISDSEADLEIDLSGFPVRPSKSTRVQISIHYKNELECTITLVDKGFGEFYTDAGTEVTKYVNLQDYIIC